MSTESKFNTGDKVRVINYGSIAWEHENQKPSIFSGWAKHIGKKDFANFYDTMPELIGKEGVVNKASLTEGRWSYALDGISEKSAWYHEDQLELIMSNKTQMVTIEAPVGALIITKEQIEHVFRQMFEDGIACAGRHFTNDDLVDEFFKKHLDSLLKPYREGIQQSKYGIGGTPL